MIVFALCLCHIVCLQLHLILSMGGRVVISHLRGSTVNYLCPQVMAV